MCLHTCIYIYLYFSLYTENHEFTLKLPITVQHPRVHSSFLLFHVCSSILMVRYRISVFLTFLLNLVNSPLYNPAHSWYCLLPIWKFSSAPLILRLVCCAAISLPSSTCGALRTRSSTPSTYTFSFSPHFVVA